MIRMPVGEIIAKIVQDSDLSEADVKAKIAEKTKQLSGLISEEGAAHIIANELGIKLFEAVSGKLKVGKVLAGMRNIEVVAKVVQLYELREFERNGAKGKVANMLIGDETGVMRVAMWHDHADYVNSLKPGDIVQLSNVYARDNGGRVELHLNNDSSVSVNPEGVIVGEVAQVQAQPNAKRIKIKDLKPEDNNVELLGTITQVYDVRFYETCPNCNRRARPTEDGVQCETHGVVAPDYSYVLNFVLDDGTGTLRVVCFRDQVEQLLGLKKEELLQFKEHPEQFGDKKTDLLGNITKLSGRGSHNAMFDRLEFVASDIDPNPDPGEELNKSQ